VRGHRCFGVMKMSLKFACALWTLATLATLRTLLRIVFLTGESSNFFSPYLPKNTLTAGVLDVLRFEEFLILCGGVCSNVIIKHVRCLLGLDYRGQGSAVVKR